MLSILFIIMPCSYILTIASLSSVLCEKINYSSELPDSSVNSIDFYSTLGACMATGLNDSKRL